MILGVLSDTHGRQQRAHRAVAVLRAAGAEALVHCGDVGGLGVLDALAGLPAWFVWGNTDEADAATEKYAQQIGIHPPSEVPTRIELAGVHIAVFHGHEKPFACVRQALRSGAPAALKPLGLDCRYVFFGHTHQAADVRVGGVRLVNPGALERATPYSVATVDLERDLLRFWRVPDEESAARELDEIDRASLLR